MTGVVCLATIAPYTEAFDWFAGMVAPEALRAARAGREARAAVSEEFDQNSFTAADWAALQGAGRRSARTRCGPARRAPTG